MKYCENCGEQLPDKAKFCGKCGQAQEVFVAPAVERSEPKEDKRETMNCPYCLETILKGAYICRYCRSDLTGRGNQGANVQSKSAATSFNLSALASAIVLLIHAAIIILSLTDLLILSIELGYGGYNIYEYSLGMSIFSCFDLSKLIEMLQKNAPSFTGQNMSMVFCGIGLAFVIIIFIYLLMLVWRLKEVYEDWQYYTKRKKRYAYPRNGYSAVIPIIFAAFVVTAWIYMSHYLSASDITIVKIGLSPTMIAIIILLGVQIAINVAAKKHQETIYEEERKARSSHASVKENKWFCNKCGSYNREDNDKCRSCGILRRYVDSEAIWICAMCFKSNSQKLDYCEYCGYPRPSLRHKDTAEVNGYVAEESLTWFCKCCLTYNSQLRISCKTCGMSRKLSDELWICSRCLKTNPVSSDCCEHCGEVSHLIQLAKQEDKE